MSEFSLYGTVLRVEKLRNSKNGNPVFRFTADVPNWGDTQLVTALDLMQSHSVTETNMVGRSYWFSVKEARGKYRVVSWERIR